MATVGYATLQVIPSMRGVKANLERELGGVAGPAAARAGDTAGRTLSQRMASGLRSSVTQVYREVDQVGAQVNRRLGSAFKIGAGLVAGAVATSVGLGLRRLVGIDDAQGKLRGLGHDARAVDDIMESALASVRGTAFGLAEAATTAASAVAAGIKPGKELTAYLTLTADAATIAGISMDEMGSIINKVTTTGRAMTENLNQLSDRGIPIFQWLQEEYGVSADKLREMVTRGEVDAETFRKVIEENIGGAALESGTTVRGAFSNMLAAAGRFGAGLIGPVFEQSRGFFVGLTGWLDAATDRVGPWGEALAAGIETVVTRARGAIALLKTGEFTVDIGELLGVDEDSAVVAALLAIRDGFLGIVETVQSGLAWMREHRELMGRIVGAVAPAVAAFAGFASIVNTVSRVIRLTPVGIIIGLASALVYAWQHSETFRAIVTDAFEAVRRAVDRVVGFFTGGGGLTGALDTVRRVADRAFGLFRDGGAVFEWWQDLIGRLAPRFESIRDWFSRIGETLTPVIGWLGDALPGAFERLWGIAQPILGFLIEMIGGALSGAIDGVVQVFEGAVAIISGILDVFVGLFTGNWSQMWEGVKAIAQGIWDAIVGALKTWLNVSILRVIAAPLAAIRNVFSGAWNAIRNTFTGVTRSITTTVRGWLDTIRLRIWQVQDAIRARISQVWDAIRSAISSVTTAIRNVITNVWNTISSVTSRVWNSIRTAVSNSIGAVRDTISRVIDTVRTTWDRAWSGIRDTFSSIMTSIRDTAYRIMDRVKSAFQTGVDAVSRAWDRVKSVTARPINWVIDNVYNKGIRAFWNRVASRIGLGELSAMSLLQLNRGGRVPGGGPDRDSVLAALTPGEFVLNRRAAARIPDQVLDKLNDPNFSLGRLRIGPTGGDLSDLGIQQLNRGGYAKDPDETLAWARANSRPYEWGGFGPNFDCSGFIAALSNFAATGAYRSGGRWGTGMAGGPTLGRFTRGAGDGADGFTIGIRKGNPGHVAGTIAGTNVESSGSRGSHVGGARGWTYGNLRYHLPDYGIDQGILATARHLWSVIRGGTDQFGQWSGWISGAARTAGRGALDWALDRVPFGRRIASLVGLSTGAWVPAQAGGVAARIGEGRHAELVAPEPMLRRVVADEFRQHGGGDIHIDARVWIGDREITDIIRVEADRRDDALVAGLRAH